MKSIMESRWDCPQCGAHQLVVLNFIESLNHTCATCGYIGHFEMTFVKGHKEDK